ncbi:GreA/GreB family elongation factor [Geodermatophilus sp. DSM 44513]|uniref:GreA/GreB family elongation factor n=1 Tax=Geodermatophilus sp. DSM 44513 TaxID=1528104 RepID=UPI001412D65A|nr:GreA/GreB family elongation factor [Geodermatophilus sp. DSM 44513]WNV77805.1 GreA/GreB family elongation factor [Geodermatophilus sp. DSM 44513]
MPLVLLVALPHRGVPRDRPSDPLPRHLLDEAAAIAARVRPALEEIGATGSTAIALHRDAVDPGVRRRRAVQAAVRAADRLGAALVTEVGIGVDRDHPVLTPDGAALLERRLADCRAQLAALPPDGLFDARVHLDSEVAALRVVLRSAEVLPVDRDVHWVEVGCRVRIGTPEGPETVRVVHPTEAALDAERISVAGPLAQALLGRAPGESAVVSAPRGRYRVEVLAVDPGLPAPGPLPAREAVAP